MIALPLSPPLLLHGPMTILLFPLAVAVPTTIARVVVVVAAIVSS